MSAKPTQPNLLYFFTQPNSTRGLDPFPTQPMTECTWRWAAAAGVRCQFWGGGHCVRMHFHLYVCYCWHLFPVLLLGFIQSKKKVSPAWFAVLLVTQMMYVCDCDMYFGGSNTESCCFSQRKFP
jgi:hypothetical protein